jgi:hypothetical protein
MILISREMDTQWSDHHDLIIKRTMADLGFTCGGSGLFAGLRELEFDHQSWDEEQRFYNAAMIDKVAEELPGIRLEVRLLPYRSRVG